MSNEDKQGDNKSVALSKRNAAYTLEIDLLNRRADALKFFKDILSGRKSGVTTPAEAMMVYGRCRELNLPFLSTIDHMAVIQGKVCADIHIKTALALRAGNSLWWEKTLDFQPLYQYTDGTSNWISPHKPIKFLEELAKEDPVASRLQYVWDKKSGEECTAKGNTPVWNATNHHNLACDYVTEYTFYRIRRVNGEDKTLIAKGRFSVTERHQAKLGYNKDGQPDPNSNWGKYERRMVDVRAWDNGFKEIGADLSMGMPEIGEMAEVAGISYSFDPNEGISSVQFDYNPGDTKVTKGKGGIVEEGDAVDVTNEKDDDLHDKTDDNPDEAPNDASADASDDAPADTATSNNADDTV